MYRKIISLSLLLPFSSHEELILGIGIGQQTTEKKEIMNKIQEQRNFVRFSVDYFSATRSEVCNFGTLCQCRCDIIPPLSASHTCAGNQYLETNRKKQEKCRVCYGEKERESNYNWKQGVLKPIQYLYYNVLNLTYRILRK